MVRSWRTRYLSWFDVKLPESDGVVIGTVALWGVIWDHAQGLSGRNLRGPRHLYPAMAKRNREALAELRTSF